MKQTKRRYKAITFQDRKVIEEKTKVGISTKELAETIGVHVATMYRELERGNTENGYSAIKAQCGIAR
ncbi:MAG: helix-turn-helix domain-containing protein [Clostridium sp.]|nr:helix-turn-helix domain-containing protein [Clostridium sp.]